MNNALTGIRIIDLSMGWAGPLAARHMADMGAEVIKIESCERFDWWRSWEATPEWIADDGAEKSTAFNLVNRNKLNVTLDLEHPRGRELFLELVRDAHAVVENFSGSVMPKLNIGYDVLKEVNPEIILLSMPPFGTSGPWAEFRAYGSTVEQSSGLPHLNGSHEDLPVMQHVAYGDAAGGVTGAGALLTALRHQAKTGEGQFVDLSQVEALFPLGIQGILHQSVHGEPPVRTGNRHPEQVPHGVYPCAEEDTWIVIQVSNEAQWQALRQLAGLDFSDLSDRQARIDELEEALATWTSKHESKALMYKLQSAKIPAAATYRASELLDHPQHQAREQWQWLDRAIVGHQPNPSPPYRPVGKPIEISTPAPTMGQHNSLVLGELLGLKQSDMSELENLGVIGTKPRLPSKR